MRPLILSLVWGRPRARTDGRRRPCSSPAITQYATGIHFRAVAKVSNETTLIMPMIETRRGLSNVEAIAAVPGIDCLLMGCADLCVE